MKRNNIVAASVVITYLAGILSFPTPAFAILDNTNNPNAINEANIQAAAVDCETFCSNLIADKDGSGQTDPRATDNRMNPKLRNTRGGAGWTAQDDLWCARHNLQTNPAVTADTVATTREGCHVPLLSGESCTETARAMTRCKWYAGQVEEQCLAYMATKESKGHEGVLMVLDLAAAGTCAAACFTTSALGTTLCQYASLAAGGAEVLGVFSQKSSTINKILGGLGATIGGGVLLISKSGTTEKYAACASAALFAVLFGIRAANTGKHNKGKDKACDQVKKLASSAADVTTASGGSTRTDGSSGGGGGASGQASGGNSGVLSNASGFNSDDVSQECLDRGISCLPPSSAAATDAQILSKSGLDQAILPAAKNLAANLGKNGSSAGDLMSGAMGGGVGADFGRGLAQLAQYAHDNADQIMTDVPGARMSAGGGPKPAGESGMGGLGSLFDKPDQGGMGGPGTASLNVFNGDPNANDIWHSNSTENIFQIVSQKIEKVSGRVGR